MSPESENTMSGIAEELSKLKGLFDQGAINEAEYTAAKTKILAGGTSDPAPVVVNTVNSPRVTPAQEVSPVLEIIAGLMALIGVMLPWGTVSATVMERHQSQDVGMGLLASGWMLRMIFISVICGVIFRFFTATARWRWVSYFSTLLIGGYCAYTVSMGMERVGQLGANFSFTPGIGMILSLVGMLGLAFIGGSAFRRPAKVPQWATALAISLSVFIALGSLYSVVERVADNHRAQAELTRQSREMERHTRELERQMERGW